MEPLIIRLRFNPPMYSGSAWHGNIYRKDGSAIYGEHHYTDPKYGKADLRGIAMTTMMYYPETVRG